MKKVLSVLITVLIVLSSSVNAFAAEVPSVERVSKQIDGAAQYVTASVDKYTVDSAVDLALVTMASTKAEKYADGFIADVKANLDANGGKIVSAYGENLATYAAVIIALTDFDKDTADFYGYDIQKAFLALDPSVAYAVPSYYRFITYATLLCDDEKKAEDFCIKLCDAYIDNYYTMGKGADYYGFSCDNTAYFVEAVTVGLTFDDKYEAVLNDALKVIDTYKVDGGYCYNPDYGTQANANSTALALMAHSLYSFTKEADIQNYYNLVNSIYADLCAFEGSSDGIFTYDGEDNVFATKDALTALSYYMNDVFLQNVDADEETTENDKVDKETTKKRRNPTTTATTAASEKKNNTSKKSPQTGAGTACVSATVALALALPAVIKAKKRND